MIALLFLSISFFLAKRTLRYLRYFQQEEYDTKRFLRWIFQHRAFDRKGSLLFFGVILLSLWNTTAALAAGSLAFCLLALYEPNPLNEGKLTLKMTPRAKRIFLASLLYLAAVQAGLYFFLPWQWELIALQLPPFSLLLSCRLLAFEEKRRQKTLLNEAKEKLQKLSPFVIGITGSYGKTSTKDALGQILQVTLGPTYWPEKGINTPMGITRSIRETLSPGMQYAVIEMGAYGKGSIKRLCDLAPPKAAILTCIGVAHLERFGSQEAILKTKAELAEAVPEEGLLVCNADNEGTREIARVYRKNRTYLYGFAEDADCRITQMQTTRDGTLFTFKWQGKAYQGHTKLLGKAALSNIAAAFTMACALGADPDFVIGAIASLQPVGNRLELQNNGGKLFLNDAYNSNPSGFASALEVLSELPAKNRYLMTPGMIELGAVSDQLHRKIAEKAGKVCDYALIVGETNRKALAEGLKGAGMPAENILLVETREEAFAQLSHRMQEGDALLIENDLTDLYELQETF